MVLLGDVGERQEMREGAGDGQRRRNRHLSQQPIRTRRTAFAPASGERFGDEPTAPPSSVRVRFAASRTRLTCSNSSSPS